MGVNSTAMAPQKRAVAAKYWDGTNDDDGAAEEKHNIEITHLNFEATWKVR
jgi:hypothetical protein